ncbi:hypothetical protein EJ110_NYTH22129 [Nymphaea thermarum]|nr:hypothetical protein EJ110_NYTH22129 [Nymphaea thermarum]
MGESKQLPSAYDLGAKWEACTDLAIRRVAYSSLAGAFGGLLLFRSPVLRWASVAFGAGIGVGVAYTECSLKFDGSNFPAPLKSASESTEFSQVWFLLFYAGSH